MRRKFHEQKDARLVRRHFFFRREGWHLIARTILTNICYEGSQIISIDHSYSLHKGWLSRLLTNFGKSLRMTKKLALDPFT